MYLAAHFVSLWSVSLNSRGFFNKEVRYYKSYIFVRAFDCLYSRKKNLVIYLLYLYFKNKL